MLNEKIPYNIKKFRELKNITRKVLADHLDMTLSGYAKIEQGNVDTSLKKLEAIADFLEVDIHYILDFDASKIINNKNESQEHSYKEENHNPNTNIIYFQKLIESLERENALLREKLSKRKKVFGNKKIS